jgi:hypothetical protein
MFFQVILGFGIAALILLLIIFILVFLVIFTLLLKIGLSVVYSKNNDFGSVFVTALICSLLMAIPCIGCILCWIVINSRHETGFLAAILVWIIAVIIGFFLAFIIFIAI